MFDLICAQIIINELCRYRFFPDDYDRQHALANPHFIIGCSFDSFSELERVSNFMNWLPFSWRDLKDHEEIFGEVKPQLYLGFPESSHLLCRTVRGFENVAESKLSLIFGFTSDCKSVINVYSPVNSGTAVDIMTVLRDGGFKLYGVRGPE